VRIPPQSSKTSKSPPVIGKGRTGHGLPVKPVLRFSLQDTAVMETLFPPAWKKWSRLTEATATLSRSFHYCPTNNQTSMRVVPALSDDIKELSFDFEGRRQTPSHPLAGHQHHLRPSIRRLRPPLRKWTCAQEQQRHPHMLFHLTRKKKTERHDPPVHFNETNCAGASFLPLDALHPQVCT